jgi:hypothetical protein
MGLENYGKYYSVLLAKGAELWWPRLSDGADLRKEQKEQRSRGTRN